MGLPMIGWVGSKIPMKLRRNRIFKFAAGIVLTTGILAGIASSKSGNTELDPNSEQPEAEFHMARMIYKTYGGAGSRGFIQPWWAIDYPFAEEHFFAALRRL